MLRTTLASLRAHTWRLVATALAVVLGVGLVSGTLIFTDTARAAMYDQYARVARNVDASVLPPAAGSAGAGSRSPVLPPAELDRIRALPGVASAAGRMSEPLPLLDRDGRLISNFGEPGVGLSQGDDPRLRGYDLTAGRAPAAAGEAALDTETASRTGQRVGDTITVLDSAQRRRPLRLVGLVDFAAAQQYADTSVVLLVPADLVALTGSRGYREIVATAAAGVTPAQLATRVRAGAPAGARVLTGEQRRHELADAAVHELDGFLMVLQIFAWIAVLVSAFVIYNTFTILLAQRVRQLALLRCVGASRGQLVGSVLAEAVAVGLCAGLIGLAPGFGVAYGMFSGASVLGNAVPRHALVLTPAPVLVSLAVGVLITAASALIPALRASRVAPVAALRAETATGARGRRARYVPWVFAALAAAVGGLVTVAGERSGDPQTGSVLVVAGGVAAFLAVLLVSPFFVGPLTALLGWVPSRIFGPPAALAVANARRNPGRAAATTAALMIGIGLMAGGVVLTDTVTATATAQLTANYPIDYLLQPARTGPHPRIPEPVATALRADRTFAAVGRVRLDQATSDGRPTRLGALDDGALAQARFTLAAGSLGDLRPGTAVLFTGAAENRGHRLGDRITVVASTGRRAELTVVGLVGGTANTGNTLVSWADFATLRPGEGSDLVLLRAADGISPARSRSALDTVLADYPTVQVNSIAVWRDEIVSSVNQLITVIAALLAFAVLIALVGIANTLSLSVFERTRESAVIRALGLTRGQLRATLLVEAVLMALVAALVGVGFGIAYGCLTARVMFATIQPIITIAPGRLALLIGIATLAAVLAAVLPARRAARSSIVSALAET